MTFLYLFLQQREDIMVILSCRTRASKFVLTILANNNTPQLTQQPITITTTLATTASTTTSATMLPVTVFGSFGTGNGQFNYPYGIVYDNHKQHILVADRNNHRIQVFTKQGQYVNQFGSQGSQPGQFKYPSQLSLHPVSNHILVADSYNDRVQLFNPQGQFVTVVGQTILQLPFAVDCHSTLSNNNNNNPLPQHIVAADYRHQIRLFSISNNPNNNNSSDYTLLRSFSSHGNNQHQTNGVFGLCCDDERKRILVADCNNHRLSVWSGDGSQFLHNIPIPYNNNNNIQY